jgi:hypothetical protein
MGGRKITEANLKSPPKSNGERLDAEIASEENQKPEATE